MILLRPNVLAPLQAGTPQGLSDTLQQAIELEHATIPLYLYALYSLDGRKNVAIAKIIRSVVIEEMLHMTLVSNVMNALGNSPKIDSPSFVPTYPGPLPGGVASQLVVHLAPFSMTQLETFLAIEEPEDPIDFKMTLALEAGQPITIGNFYAAIEQALPGDQAFSNPPRNQIGPDLMDSSVVVTNRATAVQALQTIVEQGEGTKTSPGEVVGNEYAHYYRFMEIKKGRLLVKMPGTLPRDQQYTYSGAPVSFDASGVYAVPTDPKAANYPAGSAQRVACDNFNSTYTSLLRSLHAALNGQPDQLDSAVGLMMSLKGQAKQMMSGIPNPAVITGPSFEYQPTNP
jgi:rubrerythrin